MSQSYAIRGGQSGRDRLRVLSQLLQSGTTQLLDRVGLRAGMTCLDVGCGGGDVTRELAKRVSTTGKAIGLDVDLAQLEIIRDEAKAHGISNVSYRFADVANPPTDLGTFDLIYTRFLLCHLSRPSDALSWMVKSLNPDGVIVVEDCDFTGHFCHPPLPEFDRYVRLCGEVIRRRGGDPDIGLKLPRMVQEAGLKLDGVNVVHPSSVIDDVKVLNALTMENIADTVTSDGLATHNEVERLIAVLNECAGDKRIFASMTRTIQVWGRRNL